MKKKTITSALLFLTGSIASVNAQIDVAWGTQNLGTTFTDSAGAPVDSSVTFQLGIFPTITPSLSNVDQWSTAFVALDSYSILAGDPTLTFQGGAVAFGPTLASGEEGGAAGNVQTGMGTDFPVGEKLYIWGYLDGVNTYTPGGVMPEWVLLSNDNVSPAGPGDQVATDNWLVPASSGDAVSSHGTQNRFLFASQADDNLLGVGSSDSNGNVIFATVPEPSSALLVLISALGLMRRKR